ncbi:PKD domain-containing protein [Geodermatophilus telluris]|uniref:PKD domain-containing protein n=1 Tax=Geodermatophilus telluris TaxID=1190417 RepID=UPI001C31A648|nr:PKD domain-containing protein [Geodermatophilus telluris]
MASALVALGVVAGGGVAAAAPGDIGYVGPSFAGAVNPPTADKPQSKLWHTDGSWFAVMFDSVSKTWHVFRLDRPTQTWVDTGVVVDTRANTSTDALWDGSRLYTASHVVTVSGDSGSKPSVGNSPARLNRYSYNAATKSFTLDAGFPATITTQSSESMTIDKDSTGKIWATWTQVSGNSTSGYTSAVYVNSTTTSDSAWGTPFVLPVAGANPAPDDISAVVSYRGSIGVLWSNQRDATVYWAMHRDGDAVGTWRGAPAIRGNKAADDHLNVKALQSDAAGRVFAVLKTGADTISGAPSTSAQILVASFKPATGAWTSATFGTLADCHTRPQLVLDEQNQRVRVVATAPTASGCAFSGAAGTIYEKSAPMDTLAFTSGRGTPVIRDAASANMNNPTVTKQAVNGSTGFVVLASNTSTGRYWHADIPLGTPAPAPAPTANFTSAASTSNSLAWQFTDTSTGAPTSWAWDFGDGGTATVQNPAHTYAAAGTYTVRLTATNAGGSNTVTKSITVTAPAPNPTPTGAVTAGASTTASNATGSASVTVPVPAGVVPGDVLIAQFTTNNAPTVAAAPAGWSTIAPRTAIGSGAALFAYYHVVTGAEPASYTWTLSAAQKWNAGMTDFHGVNTATPFDTAATTAVDTSYARASLAVPGVTTVTPGAMLVGGVGEDSSSIAVTPPGGATEAFESAGAQVTELAYRALPTAGATGTQTWTFAANAASAGWLRALRPAS